MRELFSTNVARLKQRDARFARSLLAVAAAEVEVKEGPRGLPVVRAGGVQLASAYDPQNEARVLVTPTLGEEPDLLVMLGFGLGHAVEAFRAERAVPVLLYEPSLPHLRAALTQRDLPWLSERDVCWAESPNALVENFRALYTAGLRVGVVVHPVAKQLCPHEVAEAVQTLATAKRSGDISDRTRVYKSATFAERSVDNLGELLRTPPISRLAGLFKGFPAVIAAAGPSLDAQLDTLRDLGDRALVIAIGQSLPALRRAGIRPDLTHVVESQDVSHQLSDGGASEDVNLVTIPSTHPALFSTPVASRFVAYPSSNGMAQWIAKRCGESEWISGAPTVAQSAVHLAAALGANPILLIGQDLAFSEGRVYARGSAYRMVTFRELGDGQFVYTGEDEKAQLLRQAPRGPESAATEIVWVPGWDGEPVPTSPQYATFIDHYKEVVRAHDQAGIRVVNCTEGGARIPGLDHARFCETLRAASGDRPSREKITEVYRAFQVWPPRPIETGLGDARRSLQQLDSARRRVDHQVSRFRAEVGPGVRPARCVSALRRLVREERRLARVLEDLPWLDMVGQQAVQRSALTLHRTRELSPAEAAIADAEALLVATGESVARGRVLLERLDAQLRATRGARVPAGVEATGVEAGEVA